MNNKKGIIIALAVVALLITTIIALYYINKQTEDPTHKNLTPQSSNIVASIKYKNHSKLNLSSLKLQEEPNYKKKTKVSTISDPQIGVPIQEGKTEHLNSFELQAKPYIPKEKIELGKATETQEEDSCKNKRGIKWVNSQKSKNATESKNEISQLETNNNSSKAEFSEVPWVNDHMTDMKVNDTAKQQQKLENEKLKTKRDINYLLTREDTDSPN